jgi:hypothetical protein
METDGSSGTPIGIDRNGDERICPEVHGTVIMSRGVVQFLNGTAAEPPSWSRNEGDPLLSVRINSYPCPAGTVCFRWYPIGAGLAWIGTETGGSGETRIRADSNGDERIDAELCGTVITSRGIVQLLI